MTDSQLRAHLRAKYGTGKYRITRNGEIHIYGKMPNSIQTGWYLLRFTA